MPIPVTVLSLERKLDYLISQIDAVDNLYVQSHLARYLAIITSGYFEQAVQSILLEYCNGRAEARVKNYVERTVSWEGSINRDKLERILKRFDSSWFPEIEALSSPQQRSSVDSVKELRDQLAHGNDNGTGYGVIKGYHGGVRQYVRAMVSVIVP